MTTTRGLRAFQRTFQQAFRTYHAPFRISNEPGTRVFSVPAFSNHNAIASQDSRRYQSTQTDSHRRPLTDRESNTPQPDDNSSSAITAADEISMRKALSPAYQLWFTCKKCLERSGHTISKQAYHYGTCVIHCPKCKSQHLISDNLKIFSDTNRTMEDIAREHGEKLRKGRLGADGDIEFYDEEAERQIEKGIEAKDLEKAAAEANTNGSKVQYLDTGMAMSILVVHPRLSSDSCMIARVSKDFALLYGASNRLRCFEALNPSSSSAPVPL